MFWNTAGALQTSQSPLPLFGPSLAVELRGPPLSCPGCRAPTLTVQCLSPQRSWDAEFGMGLLASETLHSLCSVAGPTSGPPRLWKKDALIDSPLGDWTKRGQHRRRALETKARW